AADLNQRRQVILVKQRIHHANKTILFPTPVLHAGIVGAKVIRKIRMIFQPAGDHDKILVVDKVGAVDKRKRQQQREEKNQKLLTGRRHVRNLNSTLSPALRLV